MRRVHTHEGKYRLWMYGNESDMNFKVGGGRNCFILSQGMEFKTFFCQKSKIHDILGLFFKILPIRI